MLQVLFPQSVSRLSAGFSGLARRVRLVALRDLLRQQERPALPKWQNLRLELIRDEQVAPHSLCFHCAGPMFWTAEFAAWRIEMAWKGSSPFPWAMALQPVGPEPSEPWTLARASSFDALLNTSREMLAKHGSVCEILAETMTNGFQVRAGSPEETVYVRADGHYAVGTLQRQALVSPNKVEEILRDLYRDYVT